MMRKKKGLFVTLTLLLCLSITEGAYSISAESGRQVEKPNTVEQSGTTIETIYAINALKNVDIPNKKKAIGSGIAYLKKIQNSDGGWGLKKGDKSNGYVTAKMIVGLWPFKDEYDLQNTFRKANDYILSLKNPDGSWRLQ